MVDKPIAASSPPTAAEIHQASMVNVGGYDINIYGTILLVFFAVFLIALWRAQKAKRLDWLDMLTRDGTKISATKVLQLVGGVVGTWIIVKVTLQGTLTWDLFGIYLTYVASIDGFSKFMMARYGAEGSDDSSVPYRRGGGYPGGGYSGGGYRGGGGYGDDGGYRQRPNHRPPNRQPIDQVDGEDSAEDPVNRGAAKAGGED